MAEELYHFKSYVVALVDFLGQQKELAKWELLPINESEKSAFIVGIQQSFGRVMAWRERLAERFNQWTEGMSDLDDWVKETPDKGKSLREFQSCEIHFMRFSDTIVIYSPLENQHGKYNVVGVMGTIVALGNVLLEAFNNGDVFRAGIEIGVGGCFGQGDFYGPALAKVHYLESRKALYPRIVVGNVLPGYLQALSVKPGNSPEEKANRGTAQWCMSLLKPDLDGHLIVDYLSEEFVNLSSSPENSAVLRTGAFKFASQQLDHFKKLNRERLIPKYESLVAYFKSRGF